MKFKKVRTDIEFKNADKFGKSVFLSILLAFTLIPITKYITSNPIILIAYCLFGIIAIKYLRTLYSDWATKRDEIGEIYIDNTNEKMEISNKTSINYDELETINFKFNYIKGRNYAHYDVIHNGIAELNYRIANEKNEVVKFIIDSESQLNHLKQTFEMWYNRGIQIKEEFTEHKFNTICLEPIVDKTFKEIKEMKSKLNIKSSR
jgi:hypothetical protein